MVSRGQKWENTGNDSNTNDVDTTGEVVTEEKSTSFLWQKAWIRAGESLFYMQFLHPETDWGEQKIRIERMCYHLAKEWNAHIEDNEDNRWWFTKWIQEFEAETENQC